MERITILESTTTRVTRMIQTSEGVRFQVLKVEEDVPLTLSMWLDAQRVIERSAAMPGGHDPVLAALAIAEEEAIAEQWRAAVSAVNHETYGEGC